MVSFKYKYKKENKQLKNVKKRGKIGKKTVIFLTKMNWLINEENHDFSLTNKVLAYINMYVTIRPMRE